MRFLPFIILTGFFSTRFSTDLTGGGDGVLRGASFLTTFGGSFTTTIGSGEGVRAKEYYRIQRKVYSIKDIIYGIANMEVFPYLRDTPNHCNIMLLTFDNCNNCNPVGPACPNNDYQYMAD